MIKRSSNKVKICCKCKENIYTFEIRKNRNHGKAEHLKCPVNKLLRWGFEQVRIMNG